MTTSYTSYRCSAYDYPSRKANITDADIHIHPHLEGYGIKDYDSKKIKEMMKIGYNACLEDNNARSSGY